VERTSSRAGLAPAEVQRLSRRTVTGNKFTGDGSGLTNVSAGTFTGSITESQVTNLTSDLASKLTAASPLNAANLTGSVPSANLSGTYGINISGSAASAATAGTATTATSAGTAAALQGTAVSNTAPTNGQVLQYNSTNTQWQPTDIAGNFIQNGTSQQTTASFNVDGTGVLGGSLTAGGAILPLTAAGNSKPSFPLDFKATGNTGTSNTFRLLANGTGATPVFDFQTCSGTSCTPSSTGLSIDNTGKVTFASGQTFPGTQTLTAGTGISIVSNAINNTGVTSLAGTANQINASASSGAVTLSLPSTVAVNISGNAATATTATTAGTAGSASTAGTATNVAFSGITGSTNTTAAMVVGSGASLAPTGTGTVTANSLSSTLISSGSGSTGLTATSTTYAAPATGTAASIAVNVSGTHKVLIILTATCTNANNKGCWMSFDASGGLTQSASDNFALGASAIMTGPGASFATGASYLVTVTGNTTFTAKYRVDSSSTATFGASSIIAQVF